MLNSSGVSCGTNPIASDFGRNDTLACPFITKLGCAIFIGPEFDHWQCLSLTDSLTHSLLFSKLDVTLACKNANSKLVEVVTTVADVDAEDNVGNSLLQISELTFGSKAKFLFRL